MKKVTDPRMPCPPQYPETTTQTPTSAEVPGQGILHRNIQDIVYDILDNIGPERFEGE
jgi:hypothetical protein